MSGKASHASDGKFNGWIGDGKNPPVSEPLIPNATTPEQETPVDPAAAVTAAYEAYQGPSVTRADVEMRDWERDQAERMYGDPDVAGPILFTDEEWEMMTGTREARIAFGYELQCGCRPGTCSSEYGGDCWRTEVAWEEYVADEAIAWHEDVVKDEKSVFYTTPNGTKWAILQTDSNGITQYADMNDNSRVYEAYGTVEDVLTLLHEE